jgi:orotidine-5'-phosphate decarboxylase
MNFIDKLLLTSQKNQSLLCIGLDPDPDAMPDVDILTFNKAIIDATCDLVCAYKPNLAFYETFGSEGFAILKETIEYIPPEIPIIGDAKRGDIGNTAKAYAKALFSTFGFDAATVNPYLGFDSIQPFIENKDKGVFILCRTSNKGSADFQNLNCSGSLPLYEIVACKAREWNVHGNIGLVVGATYPEELKRIRAICPEMCLLIPGVGAQGGALDLAVNNGVNTQGEKAIINVSRKVLYASRGEDFTQAARSSALEIRAQINSCLSRIHNK